MFEKNARMAAHQILLRGPHARHPITTANRRPLPAPPARRPRAPAGSRGRRSPLPAPPAGRSLRPVAVVVGAGRGGGGGASWLPELSFPGTCWPTPPPPPRRRPPLPPPRPVRRHRSSSERARADALAGAAAGAGGEGGGAGGRRGGVAGHGWRSNVMFNLKRSGPS